MNIPPLIAGNSYASAADAYSTWATALGVSPTATLSNFDADNEYYELDLGFSPFGLSNTIAISGDCVIAFYPTVRSPVDLYYTLFYTDAGLELPGNPAYYLGVRPRIYNYNYNLNRIVNSWDFQVTSSKWQKTTNAAILNFLGGWSGDPPMYEVSIKITPKQMEVVLTSVDAFGAFVSVWMAKNRFHDWGLYAGTQQRRILLTETAQVVYDADAMETGTTVSFKTPDVHALAGVVLNASGGVAQRDVVVIERSTPTVLGTTTSLSDGTFALDVATRDPQVTAVCVDDPSGSPRYNELVHKVTL